MTKQTVDDLKEKELLKIPEESPELVEDETWSKDQKERSYYYDDATGYQKYDPNEDDEDEDDRSIED